jgi:hypothetical protein
MKKKTVLIASAIFLLIGLVTGAVMLERKSNPIWWKDGEIGKWIFEKIPLGTSMDEAVEIIGNNNWRIDGIHDFGYRIWHGQPRFGTLGETPGNPAPPTICSKTVVVTLGYYPFDSGVVQVYFGFDGDGHLVVVTVEKTYFSI